MNAPLAKLEGAAKMLAEARTLDDVKRVIDIASAAKVYARAAKLGQEAENHAIEIKLRAVRKAGEMLERLERKSSGDHTRKVSGSSPSSPSSYRQVLKDEQISERTAEVWQELTRVPAKDFETIIDDTKAVGRTLTINAVRRVWHEAQRKGKADDAALAIEHGVADFERLFKLQRYDVWNFAGLDPGFGKPWPGNLPGSLVANTLYYLTKPGDVVVDPMAGGGVTGDVARALGRHAILCDARPCPGRNDVRQHNLEEGPVPGVDPAALVFLDPPYWTLKAEEYGNVAGEWGAWCTWLRAIARSAATMVKPGGYVAMLMQDNLTKNVEAGELSRPSILVAAGALHDAGLTPALVIACPLSTQQVAAREMEWAKLNRRLLGILRLLLVFRKPS